MLSENGYPELRSLEALLDALGFRLSVASSRRRAEIEGPTLLDCGRALPLRRHSG